MAVDTATILSISASVTLAICGAALVLLVIWQGPRRRSHQYFGLCMALFALYGAFNAAWQVPQQFEIEPEPLLNLTSTVYVVGIIMLFNFVIAYGDMSTRSRRIEHVISIPLGLLFIVLTWTGHVYANFEPVSNGGYDYELTRVGLVGVSAALLYLLTSIGLLYARHSRRATELSIPLGLLVIGMIGFALTHYLRDFAFNTIALTVAVIFLGRTLIKNEVFQPLADLNAELSQKNTELLEATHLKSQFLANMSHELRTPLNSIIGYTELVVNETYGPLNDTQSDRLQKVTRNGRLLLDLINDVLDLSKIDAGRLDLVLTEVPPAILLNSLLDSIEPRVLEKGLTLVRGYGELPTMRADEGRVRQILSNLLSNAIKFTDEGAIIVRGYYDSGRHQVVLSVSDTGIGIDSASHEHIFEAFHVIDGSLTRQHEGTGLGLAIARSLTELHGGSIWLDSTPGQGSTFFVALPAASEHPPEYVILRPARQRTGPAVLAIDDELEALELLKDYLERAANLQVWGATDPNDGLRLARELVPAAILLDIRMPGLDGWHVLEALRRDPRTAAIPVLVVSATDDKDVADFVGVAGFVAKPFPPHRMLELVERLLAPAGQREDG